MRIYFNIANEIEEENLKNELRNGGFPFNTIIKETYPLREPIYYTRADLITGSDIEYLSQVYDIIKITDES